MDSLTTLIVHYGYPGLTALLMLGIVGLPIPDETLLVFSGFLVFQGKLSPLPTFFAGLAGAVSGITISYLLGRTLGRTVVDRYGRYLHITTERLDRVERWFERIGDWLLPAGFFIPGVRHFTALTAGIAGLPFPRFGVFAYCGAAVWVAFFLCLGYFVGNQWQAAMHVIHQYTGWVVAALISLGFLCWLMRRRIVQRQI